jgi:hypothetical protein
MQNAANLKDQIRAKPVAYHRKVHHHQHEQDGTEPLAAAAYAPIIETFILKDKQFRNTSLHSKKHTCHH